ncbi:MAG TPA: hypothetical protein VJ571_08175 [Candidatus Nitrosotalea sp.]|nr:hypothetical protein [Candidatus Nitrosotalea sp.]
MSLTRNKDYVHITCRSHAIDQLVYITGYVSRHVKDMSSNAGHKRKPTVAIKDDVYEKAKNKAAEKGLTLVDYVNEIILQNVEKDEFLKNYAPYIEKISTGDTIILRDNKIKTIVEVYLKEGKMHCSNDEGRDCIHVHFALGLPEVGRLKKK